MLDNVFHPDVFSAHLFEIMKRVNPGIENLALYEFRYCLNNVIPEAGWASIHPDGPEVIEQRVNDRAFYETIQIKPVIDGRIVLDEKVLGLTRMLLVGLVTGIYTEDWLCRHFYFDLRGFYFLHRTTYFTDEVQAHFGGAPYQRFEQKQKLFDCFQGVGYQDFMAANAEVDELFIDSVKKLIAQKGTPVLLAIAGPTAAGKTEIVERLSSAFSQMGKSVTSIELDNFLTDRDHREAKRIFTLGKQALHFNLLVRAMEEICKGQQVHIPRYDFVFATSSHDLEGNLRPGCQSIEIEPADIIFIEGNFPFLIEEVLHLIAIKVVYLTDDPVRMKRKWKRDIDYRKKYEPTYFRNRYFKDQFIMAEVAYRPQMKVCDLCVDTTGGALWASPETAEVLASVDSVNSHLEFG
jgi:uridine kinase